MSEDELKAALAQLEAERERRIEAKVTDDKAIREPLIVVTGGPEDIDAKVEDARAARLAELRDEKREVIFDTQVIITGVPRGDIRYDKQNSDKYKPDYTSHLRTHGTKSPREAARTTPARPDAAAGVIGASARGEQGHGAASSATCCTLHPAAGTTVDLSAEFPCHHHGYWLE